jgi:hypothetical protein
MPIDIQSLLKGEELAEYEALTPERQAAFRAQFEDAISETLKPIAVVIGVAERVLDLAHNSELLTKVAKLQRRYFEALVEEGFTVDQAMALSTNFGSVLSSIKKG